MSSQAKSKRSLDKATTGLAYEESTVFEQSVPGRAGYDVPELDVPDLNESELKGAPFRKNVAELPELSEADVVRHFTRISINNYHKDLGFYPLGSCTMKYNPKSATRMVSMPGFSLTHPFQPVNTTQGNLQLLYQLERMLCEISGMDGVTLWPAAGSHGELAGMLMIHAYHQAQGNPRKKVLIPDSAHGTNPASAAIVGYEVVEIKSNGNGLITPQAVAEVMDEEVAAIMITNPNTLGLFEEHFRKVADIVHQKGGLVYCDGANLNALMGYVKLGRIGCDVMHFNLHKTFATPHGGGGPGAGPVGVKEKLEPYLPTPIIVDDGKNYALSEDRPHSIGRIKSFYGNFGVLVRAYSYIREMGGEGLKRVTQMAVLNANYIRKRLEGAYHLPYTKPCMHECVFSDKRQNEHEVKTMNIAKRLADYGVHPPTIYFPLIVPGALMIEPTETENKDQLDEFCEAMVAIAKECETDPDVVKSAPHKPYRRKLDEVRAAKEPRLKY